MKSRPRAVEREIAERLSLFYTQFGLSPVKRIPVLGRAGPDIEINEAGLAVDVKSRIQVPKSMIVPPGKLAIFSAENIVGVALESLAGPYEVVNWGAPSTVVMRWLHHMKEWADAGAYKAALVLHRPKMKYEKSVLILFEKDWSKLWQELQ